MSLAAILLHIEVSDSEVFRLIKCAMDFCPVHLPWKEIHTS